jgi:hypothetical protein
MRDREPFHLVWVGGLLFLSNACGSGTGASLHPGIDAAARDGADAAEVDASDAGGITFVVGDGAGTVSEPVCPAGFACPADPPVQGTPCDPSTGFDCEYGDDPNSFCDTVAACSTSGWEVRAPVTGVQCPTALPASCPSSFASAVDAGASCPPIGFQCFYPEGVCACAGGKLACDPFPAASCPMTRPRFGAPCSAEAGACTTWGGTCETNANGVYCQCGFWQPVSCYHD